MGWRRYAMYFAIAFVVAMSSATALAANLANLVGTTQFTYLWDDAPATASSPPGPAITFQITEPSTREGFKARRLVYGDQGVFVDTPDKARFYPRGRFSAIDIIDYRGIDSTVLDTFRASAQWDEKKPRVLGDLNFWYSVGNTTFGVQADEVIITPAALVMLLDGGLRLRIVSRDALQELEIWSPSRKDASG